MKKSKRKAHKNMPLKDSIREAITQPQSKEIEKPSTTKLQHILSISLILIISISIYLNTFSSAFVFDDINSIVENYKLRSLSNFWSLSGTRYIGFLSFALNYHFGGLNVFGYHLVNITIHIINGLLVYYLILLTFKTPVMEKIILKPQYNLIPLAASLIFVSHPIQTQAVTYLVQRFTSLATLFYLLSLVLYIKARLSRIKNPQSSIFNLQSSIIFLLSFLSAIFAMKTKEISFTLPFIVLLYEFMFFVPSPPSTPVGEGRVGGKLKRLLYLTPLLLTLLIIPLTLIGVDKPLGDVIGEIREVAQETEEIPRSVYFLTQFRVIVTYIRLLFLPVNQNLDYDYPLYSSLFKPEVIISFLFLLSIFVFAVYLYIQSSLSRYDLKRERTNNGYVYLISFGIFWFFITLSVESSVIPIRDVIFEHRLYLPSIGFMLVVSVGLIWLLGYLRPVSEGLNRGQEKSTTLKDSYPVKLFMGLVFIIVAVASIATYQRNKVWRDELSLWMDVVNKSPDKTRGHNNLGTVYDKQRQFYEAIKEYKLTLTLKPDNADAHYNLGVTYEKQGQFDDAIKEYKLALTLKPDYAMAHNNLGATYEKQEQFDDAIKEYKLALIINPDNAEAHNNLGNAYNKQGQLDEAIKEYLTALRINPDIAEIHNNLGSIYHKEGRLDEAIKEYLAVLRINPDIAEVHNNLGATYEKQEQFDDAIKEYKLALTLKPDNATAHYNLARAYSMKGLNDKAIEELERALKLKPDYVPAKQALEFLRRR